MYVVYALKSDRDGRIYVGLTASLGRRLKEHNLGNVFSTKGFRPWRVLYTETVGTRKAARLREKYLKSGIGKEFLKSIVPG